MMVSRNVVDWTRSWVVDQSAVSRWHGFSLRGPVFGPRGFRRDRKSPFTHYVRTLGAAHKGCHKKSG
jgi:hypothetical protein